MALAVALKSFKKKNEVLKATPASLALQEQRPMSKTPEQMVSSGNVIPKRNPKLSSTSNNYMLDN